MIMELDDKAPLGSLLGRLKIPPEEVTVIMVNGKREQDNYPLRDGDRVGIFPLIGGG
jgi:molybdopterin converting factor small subunit